MQCFFDQLIGDMRPTEVAGVDVVDSEPNDLAQDCDRAVGQGGRGHRFQIKNYELRIRKNENDCSVRCPQRRNSIHFILR
jgi:hypothetical protein